MSSSSARQTDAIAVLGAGSWGTALGVHLARSGHHVRLWARDPRLAREMRVSRRNPRYLRDAVLPAGVEPTDDPSEALAGAGAAVIAVPSHEVRGMVRLLRGAMAGNIILVSAAKGLEVDSLQRMSQVIADEAPG